MVFGCMVFKVPRAKRHPGSINRYGIENRLTAGFFFSLFFSVELWSSLLVYGHVKFTPPKNTAVRAAILCLAICVCDVTNNLGWLCGTSVYLVMNQVVSMFFNGKD